MGSQRVRAAALLMLGVAMVWGCESNDVLAPAGTQIIIQADPSTLVIDLLAGQSQAQSLISAQLFDSTGAFPQQGIDVTFSATGGVLGSSDNTCGPSGTCKMSGGACSISADCPLVAAQKVKTDGNGVARDVLTVGVQDGNSISVSVRSSSATASVAVTKTVLDGTPVARIVMTPPAGQVVGESVEFDGSESFHPLNEEITCYQWIIASDPPTFAQGRSVTRVSSVYAVAQTLSATLRVSDRSDADTFCGAGSPRADPSFFSDNIASITGYRICDTASAGDDQTVTLSGGTVNVMLSFTGSGVVAYSWNCGNGAPLQTTSTATCTYTAADVFTATLTVTTACGISTSDNVDITVNTPTP